MGAGGLEFKASCEVLLLRLPLRRPRGSKRTECGMLCRLPPLVIPGSSVWESERRQRLKCSLNESKLLCQNNNAKICIHV